MSAYLFTWVPSDWRNLYDICEDWKHGKPMKPVLWRSSASADVPAGARVFLMRQREEPRGIVAAGYTVSGTTPEKMNKIVLDQFGNLDEPLIPVKVLYRIKQAKGVLWNTRRSGEEIEDKGVITKLERAWRNAMEMSGSIVVAASSLDADADGEREGDKRYVKHLLRERSRSLVKKKKNQAMTKFHKLSCEACGCDPVERYGSFGDVIECHHINWLSFTGKTITNLNDLALLCPTCHRIAHKGRFKTTKALRKVVFPS